MIAGIFSPAGIKDDRPAPTSAPQGSHDFFRQLDFSLLRKPERLPAFDSRPRRADSTPEPRQSEPRREKISSSQREPRAEDSARNATTALRKAEPAPEPEAKDAADPDAPAGALGFTDGGRQGPGEAGRPAVAVQLGAAAYRLSPHGNGEAAFAEAAGGFIPPAGEKPGQSLPVSAQLLEDAAILQAVDPATLAEESPTKPLNAIDVLNLSRKPTGKPGLLAEGELEAEGSDAAKFRNDMLERLGRPIEPNGTAQGSNQMLAAALKDSARARPEHQAPGPESVKVLQPTATDAGAAPLGAPQQNSTSPTSVFGAAEPKVSQEQLLDRIVQQARWLIRNNRSEVTLKLHPERLGELKIKIRQDDVSLRVEMTVDNVGVKRLIEAHLNDLQTQLQSENLAGGNLIFNVDVRQEGGFHRPPETAGIPSGEVGRAKGRETELEQTPASRLSRPLWGRFGVGIYA